MSAEQPSAAPADVSDDIIGPLLESAGDFLGGRHQPARCKTQVGIAHPVDMAMWREMAGLGWTGLILPERLGGSGLSLAAAAALSELFGRSIVPEPLVAASIMPATLLAACPESDAVHGLADALNRGERLLTLAWQNRAGQLEAIRDDVVLRDGRLHGRRGFVPVADDGAILLVLAEQNGRSAIVAVEAGASGVTIRRQAAGLSSLATVDFGDAQILHGAALCTGDAADVAVSATLNAGTCCAAAQLAGLGHGALSKTLDYVTQRVQFGRPIGSFQTIQHRCVDRHIDLLLADAAWRHALRTPTVVTLSAAKARCGDAALKVCREAIQMHGAIGFTEEADIGLYLRAALHLSSWLGTPALQRRRFVAAGGAGQAHD